MSEQPINQWNMTTEPSDMMKINTPMPITVAPSPSNQMEVIDDDSFSYDGYQVVRGEFFAHIYEPSFTFNNYKVCKYRLHKKTTRCRICANISQSH